MRWLSPGFGFFLEDKVSFAATRVAQKLGYTVLKSKQLEVVNEVVNGRDIFHIFPTEKVFVSLVGHMFMSHYLHATKTKEPKRLYVMVPHLLR